MKDQQRTSLPIGYWLKQADHLLTEQINKVHAAHGVSRFDWQVLNILNEVGSTSRERVSETMRAFVSGSDLADIMSRLIHRGWVERDGAAEDSTEAFRLTVDGRRQHEVLFASQKEIRAHAMQGISGEEYATAVRVLRQIVHNLGGNSEAAI